MQNKYMDLYLYLYRYLYIYIFILKTPFTWMYWEKNKWIPELSFRKKSDWLLEYNIHPSYGRVFSPVFRSRYNTFFTSFALQIFLMKFPEDHFVVDHWHWHLVTDTYRNANNSNLPPNNKKILSEFLHVEITIN